MRRSFLLPCAAIFLASLYSGAVGQQSASSPWIATALILKDRLENGSGVYLRSGLIITAAHLTDPNAAMAVRIAGKELPARVLKQGEFEKVDLSLLSVDENGLPDKPALPWMPLCETSLSPGERVIVVDAHNASQSHVVSPQGLPYELRQFSSLIAETPTTGLSGSGVFDPDHKCLLGIMSRRVTLQTNDGTKNLRYFVPASEINEFSAGSMHTK